MASFNWLPGAGGDWSNTTDWGGSLPTSADTVTFNEPTTGNKTPYVVTVASGEHFGVAQVNLSNGNLHAPPFLSITGTLTVGALVYNTANTATNTITVNSGGLLDITGSIADGSNIAETITVAGAPGTGGHLELGGTSVANANVSYAFADTAASGTANGGVIEFLTGYGPGLTTISTAITGVTYGNEFVFDGANFTGDTYTFVGGSLTVKNGTTTVLTMTNLTATAGTTFSFSGNTITAVCFAAGTRILTATGERHVEDLSEGDLVVTASGDERIIQRIKWVGRRRIDLTAHRRPEAVAPIRIKRNAFADNVPHRDLLVSPDHAILVDGMLICARQLVNGMTVSQEKDRASVEYFHVELDAHSILLAEGLTAESYLNTGNEGFFANAGAPLTLHPDLTDETDYPTREAASVAPFVWDEETVRPIWQRLSDRACALGQTLPQIEVTTETELHLLVKGRRVKPLYSDNGSFIFALPARTTAVHLVSRASSPTDAKPWLEDCRSLGVYVQRIVLRGTNDLHEVPLDHPDLEQGWWALEQDGASMRRWTDGNAFLTLPEFEGSAVLEITADNGGMGYLVQPLRTLAA